MHSQSVITLVDDRSGHAFDFLSQAIKPFFVLMHRADHTTIWGAARAARMGALDYVRPVTWRHVTQAASQAILSQAASLPRLG